MFRELRSKEERNDVSCISLRCDGEEANDRLHQIAEEATSVHVEANVGSWVQSEDMNITTFQFFGPMMHQGFFHGHSVHVSLTEPSSMRPLAVKVSEIGTLLVAGKRCETLHVGTLAHSSAVGAMMSVDGEAMSFSGVTGATMSWIAETTRQILIPCG